MITLSGIEVPSTHLSGNDILVTATTSGAPADSFAYQILLKITSPEGELDGAPFVAAITPDADGKAVFNLSGYVDQRFEKAIKWPVPGQYNGKVTAYQNGSYPIWLYPGESYIDKNDGQLKEIYQNPVEPIFIIKGRLPDLKLAQLNDEGKTFFSKYCGEGKFFSFMPTEQQVTPYQPVKLWWIPPSTLGAVSTKLKYYIGGGSQTITIHSGGLWMDILYEIDCHAQNAGVPLVDGSGNRLEKYEVWIEGGEITTEKRTFVVNWTPPRENYYYLFADNRIGGMECISLTGAKKFNPQGERIMARRPFRAGAGVQIPSQIPTSAKRTKRWTINSGYKPKAELEAMDFLLDAQHAWLALPPDDGSTDISTYRLVPVNIVSTSLQLTDDSNMVESVDIEIEEAY